MNEDIFKIINAREEFLGYLENDIEKNNKFIEHTIKESKDLETTVNTIESLKVYPEHEAFIPMSKNIFLKGRILHTGEYYTKKTAEPNSYVFLQTADQTLQSLKKQIKLKETDIEKAKYSLYQLEERKAILTGEKFGDDFVVNETVGKEDLQDSVKNVGTDSEDRQMDKIYSDKGVAIRVGDYYEIFEYES